MNINNMFNNGINPMGMNYDATAMNVKNIIQPYENKIKELEEIIRQKDFEIAVLKQKLNNSNNNMMNPMMMNMNLTMMNPVYMNNMNQIYNNNINQMNFNNKMMNPVYMNNMNQIYNNNINQMNFNNKREVTIWVALENNPAIKIQCFEDDKVSILRQKCNKIQGALSCDYELIDVNLTIKDVIEKYGDIFENKQTYFMNVIFKTTRGSRELLVLDENCPIGIAIIHYFFKCNLLRGISHTKQGKIRLFLHSTILRIEDNTPIKEIFKGCQNNTVLVHDDGNNLIGG